MNSILASDQERNAVVARLQDAAAQGRLTLGELSYRASRAYAARTWAELDRLVMDLPVLPEPARTVTEGRGARLALAAKVIGIASIPLTLFGYWFALLGPVAVLLGVGALLAEDGRLPRVRQRAIAGILSALTMLTFFVAVELLLSEIGRATTG